MADPRVVQEWLDKADEDLQFSISIIEDSTFYSQICFHDVIKETLQKLSGK